MSDMYLNGRKVIDAFVNGANSEDYPDFDKAHFNQAFYEDDETELTVEELKQLTKLYPDVVKELAEIWAS
jgi:hypothetical protein